MALRANDPRPKHRQIVDWILSRVAEGELAPGDRLPSTRELMDRFNVSNQTAQSAIKLLQSDGLAVGVPGRGTFLADDLDPTTVGPTDHNDANASPDYLVLRDALDALAAEMQKVHDRLDEVEAAQRGQSKRQAKNS